ncbi:MAG: cell division protein FtsA [Candidatus Omnitrophica bacterium]|nr:cell division protein FtsA [Candidatus Omnitrophota bacterium]
MLKTIKGSKYYCGLDLGSHSIKVALVRGQDDENLELLGVYEVPSIGLKEASISDLTELSQTVARAIEGVCQRVVAKPTAVHLGISADLLSFRQSSAIVPLVDAGTKVVAPSDIAKVNHQARLLGVGIDEEIVHSFEQFYKVDDVNVSLNPMGLYGRKLESHLLLLIANAGRLRNMNKAVHQAGFDVQKVSLSSYAASQVALDESFRNEGCALIDIGAHMTSVLFFKNGILGDVQFIQWGGGFITRSIADRLSLTTDLAEEIKKTHAFAGKLNPQEASGDILVKRDKGYVPIRRQSVCEAVEWEIENLLTHLETVLKGSALFHQLNKGAVIVGGTALLPGLIERIEQRTNLTVSMGIATKGLQNPSIFAGAIGLAQLNYSQRKNKALNLKTTQGWVKKFYVKFEELCQEYF